jgi:hypothetical protein
MIHFMTGETALTDEEKRRQKADLFLECHEAESNLAHLQEKAYRLSEALREVSQYLNAAANHGGYMETGTDIESTAVHRAAMNFDAVISLAQQIKYASQKVAELRRRKDGLGLK